MRVTSLLGTVVAVASGTYGARRLPAFHERASPSVEPLSTVQPAAGIPLANFQDLAYFVNITLGGQPFTCHIDTGSSDLWVIPAPNRPLKIVNETRVFVEVTYGDKSGLSGFVNFAELVLGDYTVPSQAFLLPNSTENSEQLLGGDDSGMDCLIGLSSESLSEINNNIVKAFGNISIGQTPLSNIFDQNPSLSSNFDIYLQRSSDLEYADKGSLFIGVHSAEHGDITKQPPLLTPSEAVWIVQVDDFSLNGGSLAFGESTVPSLKNNTKLSGVLDSGSSNLLIPDHLVGKLYDQFPGSFSFERNGSQSFVVDCMTSANVSITMGGVEYNIHPLDLTKLGQEVLLIDGKNENVTICAGTVSPVSDLCSPDSGCNLDFIMGDSFLRNTVTSFNFGNRTQATTPRNGSFVQLLPLTNQSDAWSDFLASRAANLKSLPRAPSLAELRPIFQNTTNSSSASPATTSISVSPSNSHHASADNSSEQLVASGGVARLASTDSRADDEHSQLVSLVGKYGPAVVGLLAGNVFVGVILAAIGIATCLRRQGAKSRNISPMYAPVRFKEAESGIDPTYQD